MSDSYLNVSSTSVVVDVAGTTYTIAAGAVGTIPEGWRQALTPSTSGDGGLAGGRLVLLDAGHVGNSDAYAYVTAVWAGGPALYDQRLARAMLLARYS